MQRKLGFYSESHDALFLVYLHSGLNHALHLLLVYTAKYRCTANITPEVARESGRYGLGDRLRVDNVVSS